MTTYQCIGGPLDGHKYTPGAVLNPDAQVDGLSGCQVAGPGGQWHNYAFDHANRRLIYEGLYAADAIRAGPST